MKRVSVLGTGLVGGLIARDLAADPNLEVRAWDRSDESLGALRGVERLEPCRADLSDPARVAEAASWADVVVVSVPGFLGTGVLRAVIEAARPLVDICFSPEDPMELDGLARERGVAAVVDCGVAPGLSNLFVGRSAAELDEIDDVRILVGGLPRRREWPWEYRTVFSPTDVIEEYTRPCRLRIHGEEVVRPALSDHELVEFPQIGTLEAFLTDGLRTLLRTIPARTLVEKTLRYPGHAERMRALRESGFFDRTTLRVGNVEVSPREVTERLLFRAWARSEVEEEFTILRVTVSGSAGTQKVRETWDLFDRTDEAAATSSMARTTGFPCALVARLLAEGGWSRHGVHPPEILGADAGIAGRILDGLAERGVRVERRREEVRSQP